MFLHTSLVLDSKSPTELDTEVSVLRRGCSERVCTLGMPLEIQSHEANRCSRLDQLTHTEEGEKRLGDSTELSRAHHVDRWGTMT